MRCWKGQAQQTAFHISWIQCKKMIHELPGPSWIQRDDKEGFRSDQWSLPELHAMERCTGLWKSLDMHGKAEPLLPYTGWNESPESNIPIVLKSSHALFLKMYQLHNEILFCFSDKQVQYPGARCQGQWMLLFHKMWRAICAHIGGEAVVVTRRIRGSNTLIWVSSNDVCIDRASRFVDLHKPTLS